jgi:hypothetical protein
MIMNATTLVKKLSKLLGKKETTAVIVPAKPVEQSPQMPLVDKLSVIQLHPEWRN